MLTAHILSRNWLLYQKSSVSKRSLYLSEAHWIISEVSIRSVLRLPRQSADFRTQSAPFYTVGNCLFSHEKVHGNLCHRIRKDSELGLLSNVEFGTGCGGTWPVIPGWGRRISNSAISLGCTDSVSKQSQKKKKRSLSFSTFLDMCGFPGCTRPKPTGLHLQRPQSEEPCICSSYYSSTGTEGTPVT